MPIGRDYVPVQQEAVSQDGPSTQIPCKIARAQISWVGNVTVGRKNREKGEEGKEEVRETKEGGDEIILKVQLQLIVMDYNTISIAGENLSTPFISRQF